MAANYTDATDTDFTTGNYNIVREKPLSAAGVRNALHTKENVANKVTAIDSGSTDAQYPSAKAVNAALNTKENTANKKDTLSNSSTEYPSAKAVTTALTAKQDKITAGTANDILTKTSTAGTLGTLTRTMTLRTATTDPDATKNASDDRIPTEKAVATALSSKAGAGDLSGKQDKIAAGTANDSLILTKTTVAGTLGTLTKTTIIKTTVAEASDSNIPTEKAVATALQTVQKMLPVGTILMHTGTGWVDNSTLPGWYQCNGSNGTPDLRDKFIKGSGSLAATGGSNTLTAAMLPKHTHSIYTNATKNTNRTANKTLKGRFGLIDDGRCRISDSGIFTYEDWGGDSWDGDSGNRTVVNMDATHEHTGGASNDNSSTTDTNNNNMPAYYSLIFIIRRA